MQETIWERRRREDDRAVQQAAQADITARSASAAPVAAPQPIPATERGQRLAELLERRGVQSG